MQPNGVSRTVHDNESRIRLRLSLLGLLLAIPSAHAANDAATVEFQKKPVALVADDWCPQHCEFDKVRKGYIIDIVSQALAIEGVPYSIDYAPWLRALRMTEKGDFDGLLTPTVSSFTQFMYNNEAVGYQQDCFYVSAESKWTYSKPSDLLGKRIGHLKDAGFGELDAFLAKNRKEIQVETFTGGKDFTKNIFKFLKAGRADMVIMTSDVHDFGVRLGEIDKSFKSAGCLVNEKLAVGLSKANPERSRLIGEALDSGIRKLRESGQLQAILEDYGLTLWPAAPR